MEPRPRRGRWIVRVAALLALVVAAVATVVVITGSLDGKDGGGGKKDREAAATAGCEPEFKDAVEAGFYVVQEDDLISQIADATCVDEEELSRLNPNVDPQNLEVGRCVNLEERACEENASS
jgi:hypothetical protein